MPISIILLSAAAIANGIPAEIPCDRGTSGQVVENVNQGVLLHLRVQGQRDANGTDEQAPLPEATPATDNDYTRLKVVFHPCLGAAEELRDPAHPDRTIRSYTDESRGWLTRLFAKKVVGKILKVNASVTPLGVNASKALITLNRDSGRTGDNWTTDIDNNIILLPYFRAGQNQIINLDVTFTSDRTYNISAAGTTLDIVKQAAALISPTGPLVTTVNKDQFNAAANFVDRTIEGLLKVSIQEQVHLAASADSDKPLATLTLYAPGANNVFPNKNWPLVPLGRWSIIAEKLKGPSIFDLRQSPSGEMSDFSAASIMNFKVSDDKTLKEAVTGDAGVQLARDTLLGAEGTEPIADSAWALCRAAALKIDSLGFTPADTGRAVWAYLTDLALPTTKRKPALEACGDLDHFPPEQVTQSVDSKSAESSPSPSAPKKRKGH